MLIYYEEFQYIDDAIAREKQLKNWHREWKINLIEESNPNWNNLWKPLDSETSSEGQIITNKKKNTILSS